jgi:hypothetical protein
MERSTEVTDGLNAFYEAFNTHDVGRFAGRLSDSEAVSVTGSAPGEGHDSRDGWLDAYGSFVAELGLKLEGGADPRGFAAGATGFALDTPSFVMPDGAKLPTRLTAVLERDSDEWKIVHCHFSVGVPDEQAMQMAAG